MRKPVEITIEQAIGKVTDVFWWIFKSIAKVVVMSGGTGSSKTYSTLQRLMLIAATEASMVITIVGQDIPNLRVGAIRDALNIYNNSEFLKKSVTSYNKSTLTFNFKNGSIIEFRSYDSGQDARSGKRHYAFFNEANGISKEIFDEISVRTERQTFLDFNPSQRCWIHNAFEGDKEVDWFISNFTHNPFISSKVIKEILAYKTKNPYRYRVYGLGLTGLSEGAIYTNWVELDTHFPLTVERKKYAYALDFGFTNSATGLVRCCITDKPNEIWTQELLYKSGVTDMQLANYLKRMNVSKDDIILADPAQPQSIATLRDVYGYNVIPARKPKDSILAGISLLQEQRINVIRGSDNLITELENYVWRKYGGVFVNTPIDRFNHLLDAIRYWALEFLAEEEIEPYSPLNAVLI